MIGPSTVERGGFPTKPLGEVAEFLDHRRKPITAKDREPGPFPYYGANGQQDSVADWLFDEPLVLLAEDGGHFEAPERGIAYRIEGKSWVNNHAHVLRAGSPVDTVWLTRVLENYDVSSFVTGSTRAKLTKSGAARIPIPVPPIEEQRRIAAVLDAADGLRAKRREALAKLDALSPAIFVDMFDEGTGQTVELSSVAEVQGGLQVSAKRRSNPVEVPYLRVANVHRGYLDLAEVKTMRVTERELARTQLADGDLLVVEGHGNKNEIGRVARWDAAVDPCVHQNHLIRVRCDPDLALPCYVEAFMNSPVGRRTLLGAANTTSGLNTISTSDVRAVRIPLPSSARQRRFARATEAVNHHRTAMVAGKTALDKLFASLQQRAFRGEL